VKELNANGTDGPNLIKIFSCDNCRFLGSASVGLYNSPYKCYHPDIIKTNRTSFTLMQGDIGKEKVTPDFCPYIFKKERYEKMKNIKEISEDGN
jgi:hypothetical protein